MQARRDSAPGTDREAEPSLEIAHTTLSLQAYKQISNLLTDQYGAAISTPGAQQLIRDWHSSFKPRHGQGENWRFGVRFKPELQVEGLWEAMREVWDLEQPALVQASVSIPRQFPNRFGRLLGMQQFLDAEAARRYVPAKAWLDARTGLQVLGFASTVLLCTSTAWMSIITGVLILGRAFRAMISVPVLYAPTRIELWFLFPVAFDQWASWPQPITALLTATQHLLHELYCSDIVAGCAGVWLMFHVALHVRQSYLIMRLALSGALVRSNSAPLAPSLPSWLRWLLSDQRPACIRRTVHRAVHSYGLRMALYQLKQCHDHVLRHHSLQALPIYTPSLATATGVMLALFAVLPGVMGLILRALLVPEDWIVIVQRIWTSGTLLITAGSVSQPLAVSGSVWTAVLNTLASCVGLWVLGIIPAHALVSREFFRRNLITNPVVQRVGGVDRAAPDDPSLPLRTTLALAAAGRLDVLWGILVQPILVILARSVAAVSLFLGLQAMLVSDLAAVEYPRMWLGLPVVADIAADADLVIEGTASGWALRWTARAMLAIGSFVIAGGVPRLIKHVNRQASALHKMIRERRYCTGTRLIDMPTHGQRSNDHAGEMVL